MAEQNSDDGNLPPEVETYQVAKWLTEPTNGRGSSKTSTEAAFRPVLRPPVPVLMVLDDGSLEIGEEIRIRKENFAIGRTAGDLVLSNDSAISGKHAEIQMVMHRGQARWVLKNTSGTNGTFVRVTKASMYADTVVIVGSRRFRLDMPFGGAADQTDGGTRLMDKTPPPEEVWPALIDASGSADGLRFPIRSQTASIGRKGRGADIELDDPLVAAMHATLQISSKGVWKIASNGTTNGIWASVDQVPLTACCFFQCGEQRFKFVLP